MLHALRQSVRRVRHARSIRRGTFGDNDPLFRRLAEWVAPGSVAIDVGAAVGSYTIRLSDLVGADGRVIALEPMTEQFELLASNAHHARYPNITCLQLAAGRYSGVCHIAVPTSHGIANYYEAHVADTGTPVLRVALDDLPINGRVSFLKIDAEGQDFDILRGAEGLIREHQPVLYLEDAHMPTLDWLDAHGYDRRRVVLERGSVNHVHLTDVHPFLPGSWLVEDALAHIQPGSASYQAT